MPRSHYPSQGGPHRVAWNITEARHKPRHTPAAYRASSRIQVVAQEITQKKEGGQRLPSRPAAIVKAPFVKAPYALPQQPGSSSRPLRRPDNRALLGLAAVLCIAAILFALIVMKQRG